MTLYAKIGTMPGTCVRVRYKRKSPKVGDKLEVRDMNDEYRSGWMPVIVTRIDWVGSQSKLLYMLDRM